MSKVAEHGLFLCSKLEEALFRGDLWRHKERSSARVPKPIDDTTSSRWDSPPRKQRDRKPSPSTDPRTMRVSYNQKRDVERNRVQDRSRDRDCRREREREREPTRTGRSHRESEYSHKQTSDKAPETPENNLVPISSLYNPHTSVFSKQPEPWAESDVGRLFSKLSSLTTPSPYFAFPSAPLYSAAPVPSSPVFPSTPAPPANSESTIRALFAQLYPTLSPEERSLLSSLQNTKNK